MNNRLHLAMVAAVFIVFMGSVSAFFLRNGFCENKSPKQLTSDDKKISHAKAQESGEASKVTGAEGTSGSSPTDVIKKYEKEVKGIVKKYEGKGDDATVKRKNDEILAKVRRFFDIDELARLSLGYYWAKISQAQQKDYLSVFRKLIERSYISKSDSLVGNYDVDYKSEKITGENAKVISVVIKEDADVDIEYQMHKGSDGWMIYNIVADTTDLVKNYNSQFNSIIGKEGFNGLMRRMKSKLKEENSDK